MYYFCPKCFSMKKPKPLNYFPPTTAKCLECSYTNLEIKFIKEEERRSSTPLNYSH
ncbi:MAG: hypothetical protein Lokiarch_28230 [Candidatus Lokiarchaeum sp. GC14_75]|nr:MAG: hypothetical protein Lokiarch_28230 [Candidatus Lokiarchaeum sp. GC14_75]